MASLSLLVSPSGHLRPDPAPARPEPLPDAAALRITRAFADGEGPGLLALGAVEVETVLPPTLGYFRDLARALLTQARQLPAPETALAAGQPTLDDGALARLLLNLPPMTGGEYVDADRMRGWWTATRQALVDRLAAEATTLDVWLHAASPLWSSVGRVHFHLAENKRDPDRDAGRPFAFLATYTAGLAERGKVQHAPLGQALRQYAGARNQAALLSLLSPVERAAASCEWVKNLVDSGALYQPLAWSPAEALALLRDVEKLEQAGLIVRVPEVWARRRPPRASVQVSVGGKPPGDLGAEALLDFDVSVTLEGQRLSPAEIQQLLAGSADLALLRGRWVEVDRAALATLLQRWKEAEQAHAQGLPFHQALRLLAGASIDENTADLLKAAPDSAAANDDVALDAHPFLRVVPGPWLANVLDGLRSPDGLAAADPGPDLQAQLRPYQQDGVRWLWWLSALGLGGCLADDMGLGKTIQVIGLFVLRRRHAAATASSSSNGHGPPARPAPSLVVAPASLLANWKAELTRFAPSLRVLVAHTSETPARDLANLDANLLADVDVVLTSYGTLQRLEPLRRAPWDVVVADEAQAIKNAATRQAKAVAALRARTRLALTGTPVENRLGDLWSIFSFSNPGLLGSAREFTAFVKGLEARAHDTYGPLRALVQPYILRRLKTQRHVLSDLPEKTEVKAFCGLTRKQTALYQQSVESLARELKSADGMARRGLVLSYLTRLKQICNHPSHWLRNARGGSDGWDPDDSGKLLRLGSLADEIAQRQDKVLVFTQFREVTDPLVAFLSTRFGRPGLVLSGDTAVARRQKLVDQFQAEDGPPFFVLSLRAGGTGLNLTAASHVIHFDRWWNPAVEDQATDRAFRIGQKRNVLVHKFICRGTMEERIDALIESKRDLSRQVVETDSDAGPGLTELSNEEILRLVSLDVRTATAEAS